MQKSKNTNEQTAKKKNLETDRQTVRQTVRQTDRNADKDRERDRQITNISKDHQFYQGLKNSISR